jgi:3-dehydroquinate synthase
MKNLDKTSEIIAQIQPDCVFVLVDTNTEKYCLPLLKISDYKLITIPSGDENKTLQTAEKVWDFLSENGATRKSLLVNLGGGMVTDLGGFAAATFKRGMKFINLPTTFLAAVDAAHGGKTGVNFGGLKNEIGVVAQPENVIVDVRFFKTLDTKNLLSGYAEMLKHALISSENDWKSVISFDLEKFDLNELEPLLKRSIEIKQIIVNQDLTEKNIRKSLNFGHTFGHAFESFLQQNNSPQLHGYCVMWGMLCEMFLSFVKFDFSKEILLKLNQIIKEYYGFFNFSCKNYEKIYEIITHDKKNTDNKINCTLLANIGQVLVNQQITKEDIFEALDYLREG